MSVNHLLLLLLFLLTFETGFSAEIPVFVKTGASVQLDIQTQELKFILLSWSNDKSENIIAYVNGQKEVTRHPSYEDRVDFNHKTFSLILKNMQKNDSGLYTAKISGLQNKDIAKYRVAVIDAVEAPVLTVNSNWISGNFCTVNFTCRTIELMINSRYQNNSCSPEEVTAHENNTLNLNCSQKTIICKHSNPVSWKENRINITQLCDDNKEKISTNIQSNSLLLGLGAGLVVACIAILCIAIFLYCKCKKGPQEEVVEGSTVYAQVEVQAQKQKEAGDKQPETTYCTVGQHQKPTIPPETDHTIYAMVCKLPTKDTPANSSDDTSK
ncbi:SLAM family member 7-like isoform X2 [Labeo rohita]|uniref:SLAM family member 7-like isoform X2 n=1 Tax=Labeo rohita TaxID=84645 RepID=UPI0021E2C414|nr:SLAM family member 7-like isoform X2 [Labeo rohita]